MKEKGTKAPRAAKSQTPWETWEAIDPEGIAAKGSEAMAEEQSPRVIGLMRDLAKDLLVPIFKTLDLAGMPFLERQRLLMSSMEILTRHCAAARQPHLLVEDDIKEKVEWAALEAFLAEAPKIETSSAPQEPAEAR